MTLRPADMDGMDMCTATASNPPIRLAILDYGLTHDFGAADATITPVADVPDAVVLEERRVPCTLTAAARTDAFLHYQGLVYRHLAHPHPHSHPYSSLGPHFLILPLPLALPLMNITLTCLLLQSLILALISNP